jgi:O-antigen ligase
MRHPRGAVLVTHISIAAILFLSLSQYLVLQAIGLNVTGPIVLACTLAAICGAALSGSLRTQWGTGLLVLFLSILSFRNADEMTSLTQSFLTLIVPVVLIGLIVRIDVGTLLRCLTGAGVLLVVALALNGELVEGRLALPGTNPIWVARMAGLALLACLFRPPTRYRLINWTIAAALATAMWMTGSRGPVVAAWAALFMFLALRAKGLWRPLLVVGTLIVSVSASSLLSGTALPSRANGEANTEWRLAAWEQAVHLWSSRPILGYGTAVDAPAIGLDTYPHNAFIELLLQAGVVGLGVLVVLMWITWRDLQSPRWRCILLAVLLFSAVSGSVWGAYELWLIALLRTYEDVDSHAGADAGAGTEAEPGADAETGVHQVMKA